MTLLKNKNAIITGGSDGIGLGIANAFAQAGVGTLLLLGRDGQKLETARHSLAQFPQTRVHCLVADLGITSDITAIAAQILHHLPQPDILVNNAGLGRFVPFMQMDEALFDAHFNLNIKAPYFLTQALLPALMARQGNIINISSYFAQRMLPDRATTAYSGSVRTPQLQHNIDVMPAEKQRAFARMIKTIYPLGHIGSPEDIGRAAAFLASDHAAWITGAVWAVDGGLTTN